MKGIKYIEKIFYVFAPTVVVKYREYAGCNAEQPVNCIYGKGIYKPYVFYCEHQSGGYKYFNIASAKIIHNNKQNTADSVIHIQEKT